MFLSDLGLMFAFIIIYCISIIVSDIIYDDFDYSEKFLFRKKEGKYLKTDWVIFGIVLFFVIGIIYDVSNLKYEDQESKTKEVQQCIILKASDGGEAIYEKVE